jgi:D-glycero-alpha-D-manno-heptose-7-phosphate kinase
MSFYGGGTDMPTFFNEHGGSVISTTFDKYCYVNVRHLPPFMPYLSELVYSKFERVNSIDEIVHPLIRECMRLHDIHEIRLTYEGDLPARTGLGTSSTFAVGMLNAFCALKGKMMSKHQLAEEAIYVEREILKEHGGWQDQVAAAFGGLNRIDFADKQFKVTPIIIHPDRKKELDDNLMLFYTGVQRFSSEIQADTFAKPVDKTKQLQDMLALVDEAQAILTDKDASLNEFGKLLDYTWKLKRGTGSKVSNGSIDELYDKGIKAGALGGKLLGAGGGGFLLFYVEKDKQENVLKALDNLMHVPFQFESEGSTVIHYNPIVYIPRKEIKLD